jgi:hypothetical protein
MAIFFEGQVHRIKVRRERERALVAQELCSIWAWPS